MKRTTFKYDTDIEYTIPVFDKPLEKKFQIHIAGESIKFKLPMDDRGEEFHDPNLEIEETRSNSKFYEIINILGKVNIKNLQSGRASFQDLEEVATKVGIKTAGKTKAEIALAIKNKMIEYGIL